MMSICCCVTVSLIKDHRMSSADYAYAGSCDRSLNIYSGGSHLSIGAISCHIPNLSSDFGYRSLSKPTHGGIAPTFVLHGIQVPLAKTQG